MTNNKQKQKQKEKSKTVAVFDDSLQRDAVRMNVERKERLEKMTQKHLSQWDENELQHHLKKKDIITEWAKELDEEEKMPREDISKFLSVKMKGRASARYIQECLPDEYKNESVLRGRDARRTSSTKNSIYSKWYYLTSAIRKQINNKGNHYSLVLLSY